MTSNRQTRIEQSLQALKPTVLRIHNDSAKHSGHVEHLGPNGFTGETHYRVEIGSTLFVGKTRVEIHRLIHDQLKDEFTSGLHALEIKIIS